MARAFAKLDSLRDDAAVRAWSYRIVGSVHRSRSRRAFWRRLVPLGDEPARDDGYRDLAWNPAAAEANHRVRAALARLPAIVRETIVLFEIEGWQVDEIATLHRVSSSAIKSRLARGRTQLRALYDAEPSLFETPTGEPS